MAPQQREWFDEGWYDHPDDKNPYPPGTEAHQWYLNGQIAADDADC